RLRAPPALAAAAGVPPGCAAPSWAPKKRALLGAERSRACVLTTASSRRQTLSGRRAALPKRGACSSLWAAILHARRTSGRITEDLRQKEYVLELARKFGWKIARNRQ